MKKTIGGGPSQNEILSVLETNLGKTAKATAEVMGASYNTYKEWKGERRNMTGPTIKLVSILMAINGSKFGRQFIR